MDSTDIAHNAGETPAAKATARRRGRNLVLSSERNETGPGRFTSANASAMGKRSRRSALRNLPETLEAMTGLSFKVIARILRMPSTMEDAPLIRAQVTAGLGIISSQLRADEARLKRQVAGDALAKLLKIIEKEKLQPKKVASKHEDAARAPGEQETEAELGPVVELLPEPSHD